MSNDNIKYSMKLYQRPNGVFYIRFSRYKRISLKTKDHLLAQRLFAKAEKAALANRLVKLDRKSSITLSDYGNEYVTHRDGTKAENTIRLDREAFAQIKGFIGDNYAIQALTRKQCDEFIKYLLQNKLKPTTVNIRIRHLKAAFKKAIEWEYLEKSPFEYIKQIPIKDSLPRALNREEVDGLLAAIDDEEFKELVLTYLYTGGRRTEVARILWTDIKNGFITLRETKTKVRVVPLAANLENTLMKRKKDMGPVFPSCYKCPKDVSKTFRKYADNAELKGVKLHDLRHSAATFMILNGVPIKIVAKILGHSTVRTTEIYTMLIAEDCRDAINTLKF